MTDTKADPAGSSGEHLGCAVDGRQYAAHWQLGSHAQGVGSEPRGHQNGNIDQQVYIRCQLLQPESPHCHSLG